MADQWQPIETAPREANTRLALSWFENGKPAEIYGPFVWNDFATNGLVQDHKGIWAIHGENGKLVFTWAESNGGGPEFWMLWDDFIAVRNSPELKGE